MIFPLKITFSLKNSGKPSEQIRLLSAFGKNEQRKKINFFMRFIKMAGFLVVLGNVKSNLKQLLKQIHTVCFGFAVLQSPF